MALIKLISAKPDIVVEQGTDVFDLLLDGVPRFRATKEVYMARKGHGATRSYVGYNVWDIKGKKQIGHHLSKAEAISVMKTAIKKRIAQEQGI